MAQHKESPPVEAGGIVISFAVFLVKLILFIIKQRQCTMHSLHQMQLNTLRSVTDLWQSIQQLLRHVSKNQYPPQCGGSLMGIFALYKLLLKMFQWINEKLTCWQRYREKLKGSDHIQNEYRQLFRYFSLDQNGEINKPH